MTPHVPALGAGFFQHAKAHPDDIALICGSRSLSYGESATIALRWAARLLELSKSGPRRVGVFGYRTETSYLGTLAALAAGAAFVPLNPKLPVKRTRMMLQRAGLDALIVDQASCPQLPEVLSGLVDAPPVLAPAADDGKALASLPAVVLGTAELKSAVPLSAPVEAHRDDLAYLLFTSGSTGTPKGVPVTHANVRAFLTAAQARYGLTSTDRLSQTFDQTFDLSVFDLFMAWEHGAAVCGMEPIEMLAPYSYLDRHQVTTWFSVPSLASMLRKRGTLTPGRLPTLRWSLFCGEPLPDAVAASWQAAAPNSLVENLYGPTELTIACSAYRWDQRTSPAEAVFGNVPIGRLFPGQRSLVIDEALVEVPEGSIGELCVSGEQMSPGYWRADALTSERFFERSGHKYYRTGDLVRQQQDNFVHLGRTDQQVKIGGFRIELGEVESVLRGAGCAEAVCLLWPDRESITAIVTGLENLETVRERAAAILPAYMMPHTVHSIDELPLNPNGKIDRGAVLAWLESQASGMDRKPAEVSHV